MSWWSGPPSFISSGPPSPYTSALLESPGGGHSSHNTGSEHFFTSGLPPLPLGATERRYDSQACNCHSETSSSSSCAVHSSDGLIYKHQSSVDSSRKNSLRSHDEKFIRKSSTDEMPCFKMAYSDQEKQRQMRAESVQNWMTSNASSNQACASVESLSPQKEGKQYESSSTSATLEQVKMKVSFNQTDVSRIQTAESPTAIDEVDEEDDASESGGSHSHTEMASIIEYPADSVTPDVSLSDPHDTSDPNGHVSAH